MASIEHRGAGDTEAWRVVWRQEINGTRRKQQKTFGDPAEAVKFKAMVEAYGNTWPPGHAPVQPLTDALTFGGWAERAINNRSRATERTKADYRRDLERHFADLIPVGLNNVGDDEVTAWTAGRLKAGLAGKTIRNLHGFASSLYVDALAQYPPLVDRNPFANRLSDLASVKTEEMIFLTPQEFATVLKHVRDEYQTLVQLLYATGLRFGEATALTVGDIDLLGKRKTLTVTKAWKRTGSATWEVGEPKTRRSRRTLSLSPELVDLLTPLWAGRNARELLFATRYGHRLPHTEVYKRGWAPAVARANVCDLHLAEQQATRRRPLRLPTACSCGGTIGKVPRIHDLRHSHVAALIGEGIRLEAISRRLGHSSITITFDRYGHLDPATDDQINAAVDRVLSAR